MDLLSAIAEGDREALAAMVSDDVVYHSPGTTYRGREQVVDVLAVAPDVIANWASTRDPVPIGTEGSFTLVRGRIEEDELSGVLIEMRNEAGQIAEVTLLLRPLRVVQAAVRLLARALAEAGDTRT